VVTRKGIPVSFPYIADQAPLPDRPDISALRPPLRSRRVSTVMILPESDVAAVIIHRLRLGSLGVSLLVRHPSVSGPCDRPIPYDYHPTKWVTVPGIVRTHNNSIRVTPPASISNIRRPGISL
jgi:hypothetical protein